jgi:hypothetical protein
MKAMLRCGFFTVNRIRVQSIFCALQVAIAQLPTALLSKKFAPKTAHDSVFYYVQTRRKLPKFTSICRRSISNCCEHFLRQMGIVDTGRRPMLKRGHFTWIKV